MAGTNDLNEGATATQATTRLADLLHTILAARPGVTVLVSTLIPMHNGHDAAWSAYNAAIPQVVATTRAAGGNVSLVDLSAVVPANHYADGLHPDQLGFNALGDAWYRALAPTTRRLATALNPTDARAAVPGPAVSRPEGSGNPSTPLMSASTLAVDACCTDTGPALAADGAPGTRWTSGYPQEPGMWLQADLGAPTPVTGITLDVGPSLGDEPRGYDILTSTDATRWRPIALRSDNGGPTASVTFPPVTARYIRIRLTTPSPNHWWSISEFHVRTS
jgi:hypothetical protein